MLSLLISTHTSVAATKAQQRDCLTNQPGRTFNTLLTTAPSYTPCQIAACTCTPLDSKHIRCRKACAVQGMRAKHRKSRQQCGCCGPPPRAAHTASRPGQPLVQSPRLHADCTAAQQKGVCCLSIIRPRDAAEECERVRVNPQGRGSSSSQTTRNTSAAQQAESARVVHARTAHKPPAHEVSNNTGDSPTRRERNRVTPPPTWPMKSHTHSLPCTLTPCTPAFACTPPHLGRVWGSTVTGLVSRPPIYLAASVWAGQCCPTRKQEQSRSRAAGHAQ